MPKNSPLEITGRVIKQPTHDITRQIGINLLTRKLVRIEISDAQSFDLIHQFVK